MVSAWKKRPTHFWGPISFFVDRLLSFIGPSTFCRIGSSILSKDRPIFVLWTVQFYQVWLSTFTSTHANNKQCERFILSKQSEQRTVHFLKSSNTANRWTLPQRGIILQKLGKKKCWILFGILLLSIVGIAVGLSVHFTATESAKTTTPVPLLIATTASPTSTTTTEGI